MKRHSLILFSLIGILLLGNLTGCSFKSNDPTNAKVIKERLKIVAQAAKLTKDLDNGQITASRETTSEFDEEKHTVSSESTVLYEKTDQALDFQETIAYKSDGEDDESYEFRRLDGHYAVKTKEGWVPTDAPPGEDGDFGPEWLKNNVKNLPFGASLLWDPIKWYGDPEKVAEYISKVELTKHGDLTSYRVNYRPYDTNGDQIADGEPHIIYHVNSAGLLVRVQYFEKSNPVPDSKTTFTKTMRYTTELTLSNDPGIKIDRTASLPV